MSGTYLNITKVRGRPSIPYIRLSAGPQRGKYLHRLVAEALLRRPLQPHETVDHKDQDPLNCAPWNLQVLSWADHGKVTRMREMGQLSLEGIEGVDYIVILDGADIFSMNNSTEESEQ